MILATRALVGVLWFLPLVAALASILACLGVDNGARGDSGPSASLFYLEYGEAVRPREQLLTELRRAVDANAHRIDAKEGTVRLARGILLAGLLLAVTLGVGDPLIRIGANV